MELSKIKPLTVALDGISNSIMCAVRVSFPKSLVSEGQPNNLAPHYAIWDTGATNSAITHLFAKKLGLVPTGQIDVNGLGGTIEKNTYVIDLYLPNGNIYANLPVTEIDNPVDKDKNPIDNFGILIGMDVITTGDFTITNFENKTVMTFRTPSLRKVDFVDEWNRRSYAESKGGFRPKKRH